MQRRMTDALCRCGHPFDSHEHLRRGTDCAWCAPGRCERFTTPTLLQRLRDRLGRGGSGDDRPDRTGPALVLVR